MTKTLFFCVLVCSAVVGSLARNIPVTDKDEGILLASPPKPTLPASWYDPNITLLNGIAPLSGPVWYDAPAAEYKQEINTIFFNQTVNSTVYVNSAGTYFEVNGVCRKLSSTGNAGSWWSWLPFASYNGQVYINGRGPCDEWVLRIPSKGVLVLDVINGTQPVRFIAPGSQTLTNSNTSGNTTFYFSPGFTAATYTASNVSIFDLPQECFTMEVCPSGPVVNETIYLFHEANDYTLINTNVADRLGDISFVCAALISKGFTYFNWVSEYTFSFNTTFGQYGLCNFGSCLGGADDRVGQEAVAGTGQIKGGQCQANDDIGNWYSLPPYNETLCLGGGLDSNTYNETVGINGTAWSGCGWKVVEKVKTINGQCLEANGFVQACLDDLGYPWTNAIAVWEQAFSSDDPTNGGCPPIVNGTMHEDEALESYKRPAAAVSAESSIKSIIHSHLLPVFELVQRMRMRR